ncbi:hypothetical protein Tco_0716577 [Tanacetum coccineum]
MANADDEPMWATDRVVAPTHDPIIIIPETANEIAIKAFADEGSNNSNTKKIMARMDAMAIKMDAQYKEMKSRTECNNCGGTFMDLKTKLETTTKNHQASIQNLEEKFDRLADKQSARPSGYLPSNTQPNPKESLSELTNRLKLKTRMQMPYSQEVTLIDLNSDDVDEELTPQPQTPKPTKEVRIPKPYKPRIPYPQRLRKEKMEAQYGKFLDMIRAIDEVNWIAFGGNTRDLGLILEETGQDCNFTQRRLKEFLTEGGHDIRKTCDAVWMMKRWRYDLL